MGERKVLNKYYPPDFDPAKLPKGKRRETNEMKVRMMLPMSVRCKTCGTFMYKGTKFNTRKEDVMGEDYLGIQVFRFYYRCKKCAAEFCMKTDPKHADYVLEGGATRNYEPWRDEDATKAEAVTKREEEEMGNAMKALENRTLDSKREMDIMAALDEMKALNAQHARVTTEQALAALQKAAAHQELDDEDAIDVAEFYQLRAQAHTRKLSDDDEAEEEEEAGPRGGERGAEGRGGGGGRGLGGSDVGSRGLEPPGPSATAGAGPSASTELQDLKQLQQEVKQPAARVQQQAPKKPAIKVMVKPKPPPAPAQAAAGGAATAAGAAGASGPQGAEAGSGKRPAPGAVEEGDGPMAKKQNVEGPSDAGLTGLLGQYGSSGTDSES